MAGMSCNAQEWENPSCSHSQPLLLGLPRVEQLPAEPGETGGGSVKQGDKTSSPQGLTGGSCRSVTEKKKRDQPDGDAHTQCPCPVMFL